MFRPVRVHGVARRRPCRPRAAEAGEYRAVPPDARYRRLPGLHRILLWPGRVIVRIGGEIERACNDQKAHVLCKEGGGGTRGV